MKNDLRILDNIKSELIKTDHPAFASAVIDVYEKLASRVPEEGFELLVADRDIPEADEQALQVLNRYEYVICELKHHTGDGYFYHVDMRSKRFYELSGPWNVVGMLDSGKRETFETGAVRDSADGKPRPDLFSPFALERIGMWLEQGARKYEPRNWEKGMGYERVTASLHRHLMKYMENDTSEDHLAAIAVNASFLMHYDAMIERGVLPESLNNLPKYTDGRKQ